MAILAIFIDVAKNTHRICNQIKSLKNFLSTVHAFRSYVIYIDSQRRHFKTASQREKFHPTNPDADLS